MDEAGRQYKIAVVVTRLDLGGAQEVALETARRLQGGSFDVTLYAGRDGLLEATARRELGERLRIVDSLRHPISPLNDLLCVFQLAWRFWRDKVDLVHTHSSKAGLLGRVAAWLAGVPAVAHTVHGWSFHDFLKPPSRVFYRFLERLLGSMTDCWVVVADSLADVGIAWGIGEPSRYRTIRAASDLDRFKRTKGKKALRERVGLNRARKVVGTVANAKTQKCPEDFVRVAALVCKTVPGCHFVYVGDGDHRPAAQRLAASLGLQGKVHFTGWRRDPEGLAAGFDVFLLTSLWEGLPCVFAQAMTLGLPVVATQVGGAAEIVREGETGYLCQPRDVEAMADRVITLLKNKPLHRRLAAAAPKAVAADYRFETMAEKTGDLWMELLEAGSTQ